MRSEHRPETPAEAIAELTAGNERFAAGESIYPRLDNERIRHVGTQGQRPHTTVLGCSDSRCPVELLFDQGVGDIFVVRVAGNISAPGTLASVEFGAAYLGTPLVLVLGHTRCGAVEAVVNNGDYEESIERFLQPLAWPVMKAQTEMYGRSHDEIVSYAVRLNVWQVIEDLYNGSTLLSGLVREGSLAISGAVYDVVEGRVEWLGEHPATDSLKMRG